MQTFFSPPVQAAFKRIATVAMLACMVIGMGGASCVEVIFNPVEPEAGPDVTESAEACQAGAVCSSGCSSDAITSEDGYACAECELSEGDIEICGDIVSIPCFTVESPFGGTCQQCISDDGEFAFNNCDEGQDALIEVQCRNVESAIEQEDGEVTVETCEICTDETGRVISRRCRPEADSCETVVENGLQCEVCTLDGEFAYRECEPAVFEPRVCETYGTDEARCFDCYGVNDELLLHVCGGDEFPGNGSDVACEEYINFEGEYCERCYDTATGEVFEEFCDEPVFPNERCEVLAFENAECVVCSIEGELVSSECFGFCEGEPGVDPNDPSNPDGAPVIEECPAECELSRIEENVICIACFDSFSGDFQEQCTSGQIVGDLDCEVIYETVVEGTEDGGGNPEDFAQPQACNEDADCGPDEFCNDEVCVRQGEEPPVVTDYECLVCYEPNTSDEVYRACEPVGQPTQPECYVDYDDRGEPCEVCFDPETGDVFFDSCQGEPPPPPPPDQCIEFEAYLYREDGDFYRVTPERDAFEHDPNGQEIWAFCQECFGDGFESDGFVECNIYNSCQETGRECDEGNLATYVIEPRSCDEPWGELFVGSPEEPARVLGWMWETLQVPALEAVRLGQVNNGPCGQERGDRILVRVPAEYGNVLQNYEFYPADETMPGQP